MKLRRLMAGAVAATVAAASLATVASADIYVPENADPGLLASSGAWLVMVYNTDPTTALPAAEGGEGKPLCDYGIDINAIKKVSFTVKPHSEADFDKTLDTYGGNVVLSSNNGKGKTGTIPAAEYNTYNWLAQEWWGIYAGDDTAAPPDAEKPVQAVDNGDGTYTITGDWTNEAGVGEGAAMVQVCLSEWAASAWTELEVVTCEILDANDNALLTFDGLGKVVTGSTTAVDSAVTSGDTAAATDASKGNADTGIEGVAAVAGLALVAAGAIIVSKKRK